MKLWVPIGIAVVVGIVIIAVSVPHIMQQVANEITQQIMKQNESQAARDAKADARRSAEVAVENIPKMFAGVTREQIKVIAAGDKFIYQVLGRDGETLAWVAGGKLKGRWDNIDMLVALDPGAETISKLHVVSQRERYWQRRVVKARYVESFVGKKAETIVMVKKTAPSEQQVQAVTKATVTSKTICQIVNTAVGELKAAVMNIQ